ncbi:hypothetical protein ACGFWD_42410 [Streptomyces sp. NPDC048448]|nr:MULTISPECIES: hypothetical protein [unclassified Streptomyces]QIY61048.1 hypothetical protein HEP85_04305 [Streptomyces sp. RPA4-2]
MTYAHVGMATTMRVYSTKATKAKATKAEPALGRAPAYPSTYGRPGATG